MGNVHVFIMHFCVHPNVLQTSRVSVFCSFINCLYTFLGCVMLFFSIAFLSFVVFFLRRECAISCDACFVSCMCKCVLVGSPFDLFGLSCHFLYSVFKLAARAFKIVTWGVLLIGT